MNKIRLTKLHIQNFKGCRNKIIEFVNNTTISGANATGKTTVFDAFTWLLFGKDSLGNAKFDIRPLDKNGQIIDNVEISVFAELEINGDTYELSKVQKQVWRKKRGTNSIEFQGNINEFEINGYPKSEKEFKAFVASIIDENIFSMVTNPNAFNSLPWKEQREILMKFVGNISDVSVAEKFGEKFKDLILELKIASTTDILKKYTKAKNQLNKDMDIIPARIDELSKQMVIVDVGALEVEKAAKEVAVKKIDDELNCGSGNQEEIGKLRQRIMDEKFKLSEMQNRANKVIYDKTTVLRNEETAKKNEYYDLSHLLTKKRYEKSNYETSLNLAKTEKEKCADEWRKWKRETFMEFAPLPPYEAPAPITDDDLKCPTCGQDLPEEVKMQRIKSHASRVEKEKSEYEAKCESHRKTYEEEKAKFEKKHSEMLSAITRNGQEAADNVRKYEALISDTQKEIDSLSANLVRVETELKEVSEKLSELPVFADISEFDSVKTINASITDMEKKVEELSKETPNHAELRVKKQVILDEIKDIERKILASDNTKIEERIEELEEEQTNVGYKIAQQERMIDLTEDFIREKMNMISSVINNKFKIVSFCLFENQINGGLKETCECTVNGVPFSSLNNGHRIIAGLDIIRSLSELYEIEVPVFIDNAEAISDGNLPEMGCQVILLEVSNDKEMKVEVRN